MIAIVDPMQADAVVVAKALPPLWQYLRRLLKKQGRACCAAKTLAFALMGTSVAQIDATFGHLVSDSDDYLRGLLDDYDVAASND